MSANGCTISTASLLPQDRVARVPIPEWAGRLHARLRDTRATERRPLVFAEACSTIANQGALVAAFQGARDTSETLCLGQMAWQGRMSRRSGDARLALLGIQPWINLGRLEALGGAWEAALERFARLVRPGADGRLCLGSARIGAEEGESAGQAGLGAFLRNVYVIDSLKALLANRRWDEVLAFADRLDGDADARADEARIVACCRLGDFGRGAEIARERRRTSRGWSRVVFVLRHAETLACAGDVESAAAQLARAAVTLEALSLPVRARLENLHVLVRVAQACGEVGLKNHARALARAAAEAAGTAEDEVLRIEALRIARGSSPELDAQLDALETNTGYLRYRRGANPPLRHDTADALFAELEALFAS